MGRLAQTLGLNTLRLAPAFFTRSIATPARVLAFGDFGQDCSAPKQTAVRHVALHLGHTESKVIFVRLCLLKIMWLHHVLFKSPGAARLKHNRDRRLRLTLAVSPPPDRYTVSVSSGPARSLFLNHRHARQSNSRPNPSLNLTLCGGQILGKNSSPKFAHHKVQVSSNVRPHQRHAYSLPVNPRRFCGTHHNTPCTSDARLEY